MSDLFLGNTGQGALKKFVPAQAVVDATGTCDIVFPPASIGYYQTGSVTVTDSPIVAQWTLYINSIPQDLTTGISTVRSAQIGPNDILEIKATNLLGYTGQTFHASFVCVETPTNNTDLIVPGHDNIFPPAQSNQLFSITQAIPQGQSFSTPFLPTSGYGSIFVYVVGLAGVNTSFQITWYTNTLTQIGNATTWYKGGSGNPALAATKAVMPVLGSFITITANNNLSATGANSVIITVVGIPPGESNLQPPQVLINQFGTAAPVGNSTLVYPGAGNGSNSDIIPGKYHVNFETANIPAGSAALVLSRWTGVGYQSETLIIGVQPNLAANTGVNYIDVCLTGDDIQMHVSNTATAAGTITYDLVGPY